MKRNVLGRQQLGNRFVGGKIGTGPRLQSADCTRPQFRHCRQQTPLEVVAPDATSGLLALVFAVESWILVKVNLGPPDILGAICS